MKPTAQQIELSQLRQMIREMVANAQKNVDEVEGDKDGDGDTDFADVMMARMAASGMPKEKALKKTRKHNK